LRPYGSVRGVPGDGHPYRDPIMFSRFVAQDSRVRGRYSMFFSSTDFADDADGFEENIVGALSCPGPEMRFGKKNWGCISTIHFSC
jgi:hypothetical protein